MNTYGTTFRVTTYGESHGLAVGAIIDGCPAGVRIDREAIRRDLDRRGRGAPRGEPDQVEFLSGLRSDDTTLGTPIAFSIRNRTFREEDYQPLEHLFRPGHADFTYQARYGLRDPRGGGRASARETVTRVVAGAIAKQLLSPITIEAHVDEVGPDPNGSRDTQGGIVACVVTGVPAGIGTPIFGKLGAQLAAAMMSIPSSIGFEMGEGFRAALMPGSQYADAWTEAADGTTLTNHCGGVQGGISNGMPIRFRVAFHPVVTLPQPIRCLHEEHRIETVEVGGRHDRQHVLRTPVIVEAMTAICLINNMS